MTVLKDYSKVAVVTLNFKKYYYAIYNDGNRYKTGDMVLVTEKTGKYFNTAIISKVIEIEEFFKVCSGEITEEVICKIDTIAYRQRLFQREKETIKNIKVQELEKSNRNQYDFYALHGVTIPEVLARYQKS